jgi:hypothetical protein
MELIDIFFYKLSRLIYSIWDLIVEYYNGTPYYEKIYLGVLALLLIIVFVLIIRFVLNKSFQRRIRKSGLLEFKETEEQPIENESDDASVLEEEPVVETKVEKETTTVPKQKQIVFLSKEIEELISERMEDLAVKLEDSILTQIQAILNDNDIQIKEPLVVEEEVEEETKEIVQEEQLLEPDTELTDEEVSAEETDDTVDTVDEIMEETPSVEVMEEQPVIEVLEEEPVMEEVEKVEEPEEDKPKPLDDFDPFFDKDPNPKYIVSKHPISGWQVKKVGASRASRLFNTKKQAINYATKQKYDFEVE